MFFLAMHYPYVSVYVLSRRFSASVICMFTEGGKITLSYTVAKEENTMPNDMRSFLNASTNLVKTSRKPVAKSSASAMTWTLSGVALASCLPAPASDPTTRGLNDFIYDLPGGGVGGPGVYGTPFAIGGPGSGQAQLGDGRSLVIGQDFFVSIANTSTPAPNPQLTRADLTRIEMISVPAESRAAFLADQTQVRNGDFINYVPSFGPVLSSDFTITPDRSLRGEHVISLAVDVHTTRGVYQGTLQFYVLADDDPYSEFTPTLFGDGNATDEFIEGLAGSGGRLIADLNAVDPDGGESGSLRINQAQSTMFEIRNVDQIWLRDGQSLTFDDANRANNDVTIIVDILDSTGTQASINTTITIKVRDATEPTIEYDTAAAGTTENDGTVTVDALATAVVGQATTATNGQLVQHFDIADPQGLTTVELRANTEVTANATTNPANTAFSLTDYAAVDLTSGTATVAGDYGNFILTQSGSDLTVTYALAATSAQVTAVNGLTADSVEELVLYAYDTTGSGEESSFPLTYLVELDIA
jgi:hypothetical protein